MLILKLLAGIIGGIAIGSTGLEVLIRLFATFNSLFGSFLSFIIPLLILAFITYGIAQLGESSKKLVTKTVLLSYCSTVIVGISVFFINSNLFPALLAGSAIPSLAGEGTATAPYLTLEMPPLMSVMTALILSFIMGIGLSLQKESQLKEGFAEFHTIISQTISNIVIPLLPFHIAGVFARLTYSGHVASTLVTFGKVFAVVIALHICILIIQYFIAGTISKKNPIMLLKNMLPAYFTAIGTQSSAATIPVTVQCIKKNGVKDQIAEFVGSLCANIHMSGSMTTLTSCSLAVLIITNSPVEPMQMIGFILLLGIMTVAAPGLPGGAVMAAVGILQTNLGFDDSMTTLVITLYLAQDSFGTACNVTGDGAIAIIVDSTQNDGAIANSNPTVTA